jgi:hypothetical protein
MAEHQAPQRETRVRVEQVALLAATAEMVAL